MSEQETQKAVPVTEANAPALKAWSKPKKTVELEAARIGELAALAVAGGDLQVRVTGEAGGSFWGQLKASLLSIDQATASSKDSKSGQAAKRAQLPRVHLSLRSVIGLESVEEMAFEGVQCLASVSFGTGLKAIGQEAFLDCCIDEIRLSETLEDVAEGAFDLYEIKCVWWAGSKESWAAFCASGRVKDRNEPLLCAGEVCCADGVFEATEEIETDSASEGQFRNRVDLKRVKVKRGVAAIGRGCFKGCANLVEATLPIDIQQIGDEAFYHCSRLKKATLPARLKSIGKSAFEGCISLENVSVPQTIKTIEERTFAGCFSLKELETGQCVATIGEGSFAGCLSLEDVRLHSSLRTIEGGAFAGCANLKTIDLRSTMLNIGQGAFAGCKSLAAVHYAGDGFSYSLLKSNTQGGNEDFLRAKVIFPESAGPTLVVSSAGGNKVAEAAEVMNDSWHEVTSIVVEDGIEVINASFGNFWKLKTMSLPASLKKVTSGVADDADKLEVIYYGGTRQQWYNLCTSKKFASGNVRLLATKTVCTDGVFEPWAEAEAPIKKGEDCVKTNEFLKRIDLKKITIAQGTKTLCKWAFRACSRVEEIVIPPSVEVIEPGAFLDCAHLRHLVLSEGLLSIGEWAFGCCASIEELVLPSTVKRVDDCAFRDCKKLTRVFIPAGIEFLHGYAFCCWPPVLEEIHFGGTKEQWQALAEPGKFKKCHFPSKSTKVFFEG